MTVLAKKLVLPDLNILDSHSIGMPMLQDTETARMQESHLKVAVKRLSACIVRYLKYRTDG
ncbi:MAG: hypothetical protein OXD42_01440 [Rhodospirillaceae bacterium]|nr:hypothetical protein [Rhodospirillaceae bacterium]